MELNYGYLTQVLDSEALQEIVVIATTSALNSEDIYGYFAFLVWDDLFPSVGTRLSVEDLSYEFELLNRRLFTSEGNDLINGWSS